MLMNGNVEEHLKLLHTIYGAKSPVVMKVLQDRVVDDPLSPPTVPMREMTRAERRAEDRHKRKERGA